LVNPDKTVIFSISQCFIFIQKIQCTQVQLLSSI
jgi:hypothetical protein